MPRTARIDIPNLLQHVIIRGIERRNIFADDEDRTNFVKRFSDLLVATETDCLAWSLLDNHVHLLLCPRHIPLSTFMRRLLTGYAVTFNLRHQRSGHLFQNRYKSIVCDEEEYLLELVRYIHLNPLRARLVLSLEELDSYPWCGHTVLLGQVTLSGQATTEVLTRFGETLYTSRRNYRTFVADGIDMGRRHDLTGSGQQRRQASQNQSGEDLRDTRVLGGGDFVEQLLVRAGTKQTSRKSSLDEISSCVCETLGLTLTELTSQSRTQRIARARSIISYIAFASGHRGVDIAHSLGITGSGVTIAAGRGKNLIAEHPELCILLKEVDS